MGVVQHALAEASESVCSECARSVLGVCSECARSVLGVCSECARSVLGVCSADYIINSFISMAVKIAEWSPVIAHSWNPAWLACRTVLPERITVMSIVWPNNRRKRLQLCMKAIFLFLVTILYTLHVLYMCDIHDADHFYGVYRKCLTPRILLNQFWIEDSSPTFNSVWRVCSSLLKWWTELFIRMVSYAVHLARWIVCLFSWLARCYSTESKVRNPKFGIQSSGSHLIGTIFALFCVSDRLVQPHDFIHTGTVLFSGCVGCVDKTVTRNQ